MTTGKGNDWMASLQALKDAMPQEEMPAEEAYAPVAEGSEARSRASQVTAGYKKPCLDIILDRKGRKGKEATIIAGFDPDDDSYLEVAAALKKRLGTGGSARGGEILIQGDRRNDVKQYLETQGFKTRLC